MWHLEEDIRVGASVVCTTLFDPHVSKCIPIKSGHFLIGKEANYIDVSDGNAWYSDESKSEGIQVRRNKGILRQLTWRFYFR